MPVLEPGRARAEGGKAGPAHGFRRNGVRFIISTDGPEMLQTYIRDELATLGRLGILSVEEQEQVAATAMAASFVPNVSDVPLTQRRPASARSRRARRGLSRRRRLA